MAYAASVGDDLTDLLGSAVSVAIKVIIFLIIMGIGWIVATWLHKGLTRTFQRAGLDRAVERGGMSRMLGNTSASDLTARLVMFAFLLFVLQLAFGIFGPNPVSDLIASVIAWLPRFFVAVVIVVVAAVVAGWVRDLIAEGLGGLSYGKTIATAVQVVIVVLGVIAALNQVGVAVSVTLPILITALATIAGILIVGVGGGLIKPMQHRWERMLNVAETETTLAAERLRAHRAATATERNVNASTGFDQPAYGTARPSDIKPAEAKTAEIRPPAGTDAER